MALPAVLDLFCPNRNGIDRGSDGNFTLMTSDGHSFKCHLELLRARCAEFPMVGEDVSMAVDADCATISSLLRWIYSEVLDLRSLPQEHLGTSVMRLALSWGLRDSAVLHDRIVGSWREKRHGSVQKDIARAYDSGFWANKILFQAVGESGCSANEAVPGGWPLLLQARSSYFAAMLGGSWAESRSSGNVTIHWPHGQLKKLIRFIHGHPFVESIADLQAAVECSSFFGVPALIAEANDWVATHLKLDNAALLWEFVDKEPRMSVSSIEQDGLQAADAHDACLSYHISHFAELAADPPDGDGSWVPLHDLSCNLMNKLLATGLVSMPTKELMHVIGRFVGAKCGATSGKEFDSIMKTLRPPAVMFNRELREILVGTVDASIHTVL